MKRPLPGSFRRLWAASAVSNIGDGVRAAALPLLATELTTDPRLVAGVAIADRVPWLVMILPGGVMADRYDRLNLRVRLDLVRAAVMMALTVLVMTDNTSITVVFAAAVTLAATEAVVDSSSMALVPSLVQHDQLERAGGLMSSTELVTGSLVGPPLGGLLFATALAIPFALAALVAATIPGAFKPTQQSTTSSSWSLLSELTTGFQWLWGHRLLRKLALISTLLGFAGMMHSAVFVLFAREELGLGPIGFGLILIPPALGGVTGSLLAPRLTKWPLERVLTVTVAIGGVAVIAVAATRSPIVVAGLAAVEASTVLVWNVLTVALRQRSIPEHLLGRVGASYRFIVFAAMPLGALVGGLIAEKSFASVFVVSGCLQLAVSVAVPVAAMQLRSR